MRRWTSHSPVQTSAWIRTIRPTLSGPRSTSNPILWRLVVPHWQRIYTTTRTERLQTTEGYDSSDTRRLDDERATRSRHLLRAILRECTYLPDISARQWMSQYALRRFRTYNFKAWKNRDDESYVGRLRAKEKEARNWVSYLRRANVGERKCLTRILFMVYGRIGQRRHELMIPLLSKPEQDRMQKLNVVIDEQDSLDESRSSDEPALDQKDGTSSVPPFQAIADLSATQKLELDLTPQLRALLVSQIKASPPDLTRRNPRRITQEVPLLNAWLRPMPQKRVKNMRKKHYAQLLDRVLPPLPTKEWQRLFDLGSGAATIDPPQPWRKSTGPTRDQLNTHLHNESLETVLAFGKAPTRVLDRKVEHALTPRFMQRLYVQVFSQCPLMDWDVESQQWKVTWGGQALQQRCR